MSWPSAWNSKTTIAPTRSTPATAKSRTFSKTATTTSSTSNTRRPSSKRSITTPCRSSPRGPANGRRIRVRASGRTVSAPRPRPVPVLAGPLCFPPVVSKRLRELDVLVLDCQAAGATPAHGDLLEIGWAVCGSNGLLESTESRWIVPRTKRRIGRAFRELTGWTEGCLAEAVDEQGAWAEVAGVAARLGAADASGAPTVIHFARFELPFLRDLH